MVAQWSKSGKLRQMKLVLLMRDSEYCLVASASSEKKIPKLTDIATVVLVNHNLGIYSKLYKFV